MFIVFVLNWCGWHKLKTVLLWRRWICRHNQFSWMFLGCMTSSLRSSFHAAMVLSMDWKGELFSHYTYCSLSMIWWRIYLRLQTWWRWLILITLIFLVITVIVLWYTTVCLYCTWCLLCLLIVLVVCVAEAARRDGFYFSFSHSLLVLDASTKL